MWYNIKDTIVCIHMQIYSIYIDMQIFKHNEKVNKCVHHRGSTLPFSLRTQGVNNIIKFM